MTNLLRHALFALSWALVSTSSAQFITVNSITGDVNHFRGEFTMNWDPLVPPAGTGFIEGDVSGTWHGGLGEWQFSASISAQPFGMVFEGTDTYELRTSWDDGYVLFPILVQNNFVFGFGDGSSSIIYPPSPANIIYTDKNGLTYAVTIIAGGTRQTSADTSGTSMITFDITRSVIPEPHTGVLIGSGAALLLFRRRLVSAAGSIRRKWLPR